MPKKPTRDLAKYEIFIKELQPQVGSALLGYFSCGETDLGAVVLETWNLDPDDPNTYDEKYESDTEHFVFK